MIVAIARWNDTSSKDGKVNTLNLGTLGLRGADEVDVEWDNCGGLGHYARDYMNPMRASCLYSTQFDHETEDCPTLIVRLRDKGIL